MKTIIGVIVLVLAAAALAAPEAIDKDKKVTQVSTYDSVAVVYYLPAAANSQNCTDTVSSAVKIDLSNDLGKYMLSTVLTAAAANKNIGFGIDGCLGGNLPKVYRVDAVF